MCVLILLQSNSDNYLEKICFFSAFTLYFRLFSFLSCFRFRVPNFATFNNVPEKDILLSLNLTAEDLNNLKMKLEEIQHILNIQERPCQFDLDTACFERKTGFEPATLGLGSRCSTTELLPQMSIPTYSIKEHT